MAVHRWGCRWFEERGRQLADQLEYFEAGTGDYVPSVVPHFLPQHHLARWVDPDAFVGIAGMSWFNRKPNNPAAGDHVTPLPFDAVIPEQEIEVRRGCVPLNRPPPAAVGRVEPTRGAALQEDVTAVRAHVLRPRLIWGEMPHM